MQAFEEGIEDAPARTKEIAMTPDLQMTAQLVDGASEVTPHLVVSRDGQHDPRGRPMTRIDSSITSGWPW